MIIARNQSEIRAAIQAARSHTKNDKVGFVPTMGALHEGHLSLIENAKINSGIVVCSIFVNPTQFNNPDDLKTYPRTIEADTELLTAAGCDILFLPDVEVMYPDGVPPYEIDLGGLDKGMEGAFRPGHFKGVCMVVERFFEIVQPDCAFFGLKDFQQLAVIRKMAAVRNLPVKIIGCPIKRSEEGLALSSRNALLKPAQLATAPKIYKALKAGLEFALTNASATAIQSHISAQFDESEMEVEYIAIVHNDTLEPMAKADANCTVCIVVFSGKVRLIDNMQFSDVLKN